MRSGGFEEGKKGGRKQSIPGKTCRDGDAYISGRDGEVWGGGWTTEFWEEIGAEVGRLGSAHLCFICIPGNGFQVTRSSLLSLEPRP